MKNRRCDNCKRFVSLGRQLLCAPCDEESSIGHLDRDNEIQGFFCMQIASGTIGSQKVEVLAGIQGVVIRHLENGRAFILSHTDIVQLAANAGLAKAESRRKHASTI